MATLINHPALEESLREQRRRAGVDRYDEVWEGLYMMNPMPNDEHQDLATGLSSIAWRLIVEPGLGRVYAGVNVSDRREGWEHNYRCPDVAVFLNDTGAINCGTHWCGGPDFLAEIISPYDRTREKLEFYAAIGAGEVLLIDRAPWRLELYRLADGELALVGVSTVQKSETLHSDVLPLTFRLVAGEERPRIEVAHLESGQNWLL